MNFNDITDKRFGKLKVISRAENNEYGAAMWLCECDCGEVITTPGKGLRSGHTRSCGCGKGRKHKGIKYKVSENGCHICTSHSAKSNGYTTYYWNGKSNLMARYIYETYYKCSILDSLSEEKIRIRHLCHNPECINIEHLALGTNSENSSDRFYESLGEFAPNTYYD